MPAMAITRAAPAAAANHMPNDALVRDAPGHAAAIARVWPRPHAPYFEADRPRRLLVGWLAKAHGLGPSEGEALATWSLRRIAAHHVPEAPQGVVEAMKRAEDRPWPFSLLTLLVELLREGGEGQKTLRHAAVIHQRTVEVLGVLPTTLRRGRIAACLAGETEATLVRRAVAHCWGVDPDPAGMRRMADRLERAPRRQTLFAWLVEELGLEQLAPPPVPAADWFRPILKVSDIERTALKFQNCLRLRIPMMLRGTAAYFEVLGPEPAVVELIAFQDVWRIGEVRGVANADVSLDLARQIQDYLRRSGAAVRHTQAATIAVALANAAGW